MSSPYLIGAATTAAGSTTLTIPVSTATSAGDTIVVGISATGSAINSVTDSKGNSYSLDVSNTAQINTYSYRASGSTTALTTSDTITVTAASGSGTKNAVAVGCSGLSSSDDQAVNSSSASTSSPSVTSGTLSSSSETCFATCGFGDAGASIAWGSGWTLMSTQQTGSGAYVSVAVQQVSSTSAVTASATLGHATKTAMLLVTIPAVSESVSGTAAIKLQQIQSPASGTAAIAGAAAPKLQGFRVAVAGSVPVPPGAVYLIGNAGASSGTSVTVPVTLSSNPGDNISVGVLTATSQSSAPSVSDTQGNSYSLLSSETSESGVYLYTFSSQQSNSLTAGSDSLTVSLATSSAVAVIAVGDPSVGAPDKTPVAYGSSASPSVATGTLTQAEENVIVFLGDKNAGGTPSWTSPLSGIVSQKDGGSNIILSVASKQVTSTSSTTLAATITSAAWSIAAITEPIDPPYFTMTPSDGMVGVVYSQTLEALGGVGAYSWALAVGSLPPGLSLNGTTGVISGFPTTAGTYTFTLQVTDAHGVYTQSSFTITIHPVVTGAPPQTPPGNLLSPGDSDFEDASTGNWSADSNATGLETLTGGPAMSGSYSLLWSAAADGTTSVHVDPFPVNGSAGYLMSAFMMTLNQAGVLHLGVDWYDENGAYISTSDSGGTQAPATGVWVPVTGAFTSPPNAVSGFPYAMVENANAADVNFIDVVFFAPSSVQILIDFANAAFGSSPAAGQSFMDVSPWVRLDSGYGVSLTSGRQDSISEVSAGTATFTLQNDAGWFTQGLAPTPATIMGGSVTLQRRCQINMADEQGNWYTRFDGPVSEISETIDPTGNTSVAAFSVTDILAELNRQDALSCWTREQVLADGPLYHWSLNDTPSSALASQPIMLAAESSGNNGPPLKVISGPRGSTQGSIAWGSTTGGVETLADAVSPGRDDGSEYWIAGQVMPSSPVRGLGSGAAGPLSTPMPNVYFTPYVTSGTAQNQFGNNIGYQLQAFLPQPLTTSPAGGYVPFPQGGYTIEGWGTVNPAVGADEGKNTGPWVLLSLGSSTRNSDTLVVGLFQTAGVPTAGMALYKSTPGFAGLNFPGVTVSALQTATVTLPYADTVDLPHHFVVTVQSDPGVATVYVDGNVAGSFTLPEGTIFDTICVGGAYGFGGNWYGAASLVSIYPYPLTQYQITQHCQLGQYGMWESPADDCIALLGEFAEIPSYWNNLAANHCGLSLTEYLDLSNENAYTNMTVYEQTEMGLLFVNRAGQLTFHTRDWRMGHGPPKLVLEPDSYSANLNISVVDTYQVNEAAVASAAFPGAASYVNATSQAEFGTYATNPAGTGASAAQIAAIYRIFGNGYTTTGAASTAAQLAPFSWSRGYGFYGLTAFEFWPDPQMEDMVAWQANYASSPWQVAGGIVVDLLTPGGGITPSAAYTVEIDDVISLGGTLPESMLAQEMFVEGISEFISQDSRTITFYASPASSQRAWVPGDPVYGVLSATTRIGVSQPDLSVPPSLGKRVGHDGGPPYWPPVFSPEMNSPAGTGGFVGGLDWRGLVWPLQNALYPPIMVASAEPDQQAIASGALSAPQVFFDTLSADTASGMGIQPGWPNWYVCMVPGFYEIDAGVVYATSSTGGGDCALGWIVVARGASQAIAEGTATPLTVDQYVCPTGEAVRFNGSLMNTVASPSARVYLGLGDMVTLATEQTTGASHNTGTGTGGSRLSVRYVGMSTTNDTCEINTSISSGGSVTNPSAAAHGTKVYSCQHTYSHYGTTAKGGKLWNQGACRLSSEDGNCRQGCANGAYNVTGSYFSLIRFPYTQMQADLAGKTLLNVTLKCTNTMSYYKTGATALLGTYYTAGESGTWQIYHQSPITQPDIWSAHFARDQELTFALNAAQFQKFFISNGAHGLVLGDARTQALDNYGIWAGGPGSWVLTVEY